MFAATACQAPTDDAGRGTVAVVPVPEEAPLSHREATARHLQTGWTLLDAGDVDGAAAVRDALFGGSRGQPLDPAQRLELTLLDAGVALARGDVEGTAERLAAVTPEAPEPRLRHVLLRADVAAARGDRAAAVATLLGFEAASPDDALRLGRAIWRHGTRAEGHRLAARARDATTVEERVWWLFLRTYNEALTPTRQERLWLGWRQGHAAHPAAVARPAGLEAPTPTRVALLLPLSGRLASAGKTVRDGFLAAYLAAGPLPTQSIMLYDTAASNVEALYEEALAAGVDAIVGPLSKENAARMWRLDPVMPTVTLNSIPGTGGNGADGGAPSVVQFALAVEDEGRALARRVEMDGGRRIMVFRARSDWSDRAAAALEASLSEAVALVDMRVFPDIGEVTAVVGEAFAIEESQARQAALARLFGGRELEFTARRRADVDGVVALLDGEYTASMAAALRFHYAAGVPVYASSQGLRGGARALEGTRVCDIPWRLFPPELKATLQGPFASVGDAAESLFAFGVDAFRIESVVNCLGSIVGYEDG